MIKIVGDINLTDNYFDVGFGIGSMLKKGHYNPFQNLNRDPADCWIGNFEGVASETSINSGKSAFQFRVDPQSLSLISHFDYYGVANNHVMQHGSEAYQRTIETLHGYNAKCFGSIEQKSQVFDHQGRTISITGFSLRIDAFSTSPLYWHNPELSDIQKELLSIPPKAFKIVYIHWGCEFVLTPTNEQKRLAHWLIDSGFDLVIGLHPHVLQGYEIYKDKYIFYSLGNFVFDMAWQPTRYGGVVSVDLSKVDPVIKISYIKINALFQPEPVDSDAVPVELKFETLNRDLSKEYNFEGYSSLLRKNSKKYKKANYKDIFFKILKHPNSGIYTITDFLKRKL